MHEHILAATLGLDKSVALGRVEPLHGTCSHISLLTTPSPPNGSILANTRIYRKIPPANLCACADVTSPLRVELFWRFRSTTLSALPSKEQSLSFVTPDHVPGDGDELRQYTSDSERQKIFVMAQALSTLHKPQVANDAVSATAHLREHGAFEIASDSHCRRMPGPRGHNHHLRTLCVDCAQDLSTA